MFKKILSLTIAAVMVVGMGISVYAAPATSSSGENVALPSQENYGTVPSGLRSGYFPTIEEQMQLNLRNNIVAMKLQDVPETKVARATTWTHLPNTFYCYQQINNSYCVAASIQADMRYLTGSTDDQETIAKDAGITTSGGTLDDAKTYLNANQKKNDYVIRDSNTSLSTMKSNLYSAISTYKAPAMLGIAVSSSDGWAYDTGGHALNVNAARDDQAYFQMADPLIKYLNPNNNPFYSMSASAVYKGISAVNGLTGYIF